MSLLPIADFSLHPCRFLHSFLLRLLLERDSRKPLTACSKCPTRMEYVQSLLSGCEAVDARDTQFALLPVLLRFPRLGKKDPSLISALMRKFLRPFTLFNLFPLTFRRKGIFELEKRNAISVFTKTTKVRVLITVAYSA